MRSFPILMTGLLVLILSPLPAADFPVSPDWEPLSEIIYYHPDNLWEYINGAADQFIDYGFRSCAVGEFRTDALSFSIDIYDMVEPINAYGVYATESRGIETRLPIGSQAAISLPSQCLMFKGHYYIKIYVFEGELKAGEAENILTFLAVALPGDAILPSVLERLPAEKRVSGSTGYARIGYLGLSELKNCLYASYSDQGEDRYQIFIVLPESGSTDQKTFEALAVNWKTVEWEGPPLKIRKIPYQGYAGIMLSDKGMSGVASVDSPELVQQRLKSLLQP